MQHQLTRISLGVAALLSVAAAFSACTTKRDGIAYRWYHNTTAHYNGYFYSRESMKEAREKLEDDHAEDYDEVLPVFIYGTEETARNVYPLLERSIEKSGKVVERHTMEISDREKRKMKRPEMNKWIDENYMLVAQGYFLKRNYFKSEELFKYCTRKFKENEVKAAAGTWLARVYIELEEYTRANNELLKVAQLKNVPDEVRADFYMVNADMYIRQQDYKKAAIQIEEALGHIKKKKDRARPTFILAQLYQRMEESQRAIDLYETVLKLKPEYEMSFYAQINQAMAFSRKGGNSTIIKEKLFKMLKDDKNYEYRDQIYYALADVHLEERERSTAVENLMSSLQVNQGNVKQRGKSYLGLADVHFEDRRYELAQAYYDSTLNVIDEEHKRYKDIRNKAESLNELVANLMVIELEDSLQALARLSPEELDKKLDQIIRQLEEEKERKRQAEEAAMLAAMNTGDGLTSNWVFYNPSLRSSGQENFKSVWGDRPLEDNWRRSQKQASFDSGPEEEEEIVEAIEEDKEKDDIPDKTQLAEGIPNTESELAASNAKLAEAFYNCGLIYKEKLDDFENAVESFEILADRFETSEYHILSCYQLYRAYLSKEKDGYQNPFCGTCNSRYWGDKVLELYPDSEYAMLIRNPDFKSLEAMRRAEEMDAYGLVLEQYRIRNYSEVITACNKVIEQEKTNHLLPKYYFLKALATGGMDRYTGQRDNYISALEDVSRIFPETEEQEKADEILAILRGEFESGPEPIQSETDSPFEIDPSADHYFVIVFTKDRGNFNDIKAKISDFNGVNYASAALKTSSNLIDKDHYLVLVKTFKGQPDAEEYHKTFVANTEMLADLNTASFDRMLISKKNYVTLFKEKNLEEYRNFFEQNYLK